MQGAQKGGQSLAAQDEATQSQGLREVCEANNISHHRAAMESISPRGQGFPFLKVTFTTQSERWNFTRSLNAIKGLHKYTVSPMEPREVSNWLPGYKRVARDNILVALNNKGYRVNDKEVMIFTKWKYRPFHFVWQVRCVDKDINFDIHDNEAFDTQIPKCTAKRRDRYTDIMDGRADAPTEEATHTPVTTSPPVVPPPGRGATGSRNQYTPPPNELAEPEEVEPEAREAMVQLAKAVSTSDSDNTEVGDTGKELSEQEVFLVKGLAEVAVKFTKAVTKFCNAYHNDEVQFNNAKPTSKTLAEMETCYQDFITAYQDAATEPGRADEFFKGKNRLLHLKIFKKLQDRSFPKPVV